MIFKSLTKRVMMAVAPELTYKLQTHLSGRVRDSRSAADIYSDIYERNLWGGARGEFYSGAGSDDETAERFAAIVVPFIAARNIRSLVDLGCGDFRVGARLVRPGLSYVGVDIVPTLVDRNQSQFGGEGVSFTVRDIIRDELPLGDLCIVRQVLQHMSNAQISAVLPKLRQYRYAIVAEHHPAPGRLRRPNVDKLPGFDIRIDFGSGVFLERPPFADCGVRVMARIDVPPSRHPGELLTLYLVEGN